MLSMQQKHFTNENHWFNKMESMSTDEFEAMPYGFVKKYAAILNALAKQRLELHTDENYKFNNYYS